ncbi:hypothetical protein N0Y54_28865 [Nostoc punctiforme UO1]|uniref:hypothetical protein n=1 Tax=Nostoc punctiforme TaxID=272131 RepID=UPI0030A8CB1A
MQKNDLQIFPNAILISALQEQWKPKAWRDEYLELLMLESPGQRWWNAGVSKWGMICVISWLLSFQVVGF